MVDKVILWLSVKATKIKINEIKPTIIDNTVSKKFRQHKANTVICLSNLRWKYTFFLNTKQNIVLKESITHITYFQILSLDSIFEILLWQIILLNAKHF